MLANIVWQNGRCDREDIGEQRHVSDGRKKKKINGHTQTFARVEIDKLVSFLTLIATTKSVCDGGVCKPSCIKMKQNQTTPTTHPQTRNTRHDTNPPGIGGVVPLIGRHRPRPPLPGKLASADHRLPD